MRIATTSCASPKRTIDRSVQRHPLKSYFGLAMFEAAS